MFFLQTNHFFVAHYEQVVSGIVMLIRVRLAGSWGNLVGQTEDIQKMSSKGSHGDEMLGELGLK